MKKLTVMDKSFRDYDAEITLAGHIEDYLKDFEQFKNHALQELEEHLDSENDIIVKEVEYTNLAYSCSRYEMGEDANDEGYSYWINYHKEWKQGLGKCVSIKIKFTEVDALEKNDDGGQDDN